LREIMGSNPGYGVVFLLKNLNFSDFDTHKLLL
jgi:hypothetical protein